MKTHGFFMPFSGENFPPPRPLFQGRTTRVIRLTNFLTICAPEWAPSKTRMTPARNSAASQVKNDLTQD
jgi:hypothetical protein